jgi:hypothetical protein
VDAQAEPVAPVRRFDRLLQPSVTQLLNSARTLNPRSKTRQISPDKHQTGLIDQRVNISAGVNALQTPPENQRPLRHKPKINDPAKSNARL